MDKEVVVISGTSKGIGRKLAEYFLKKNAIVYGCSRGDSDLVHELYHHKKVDIQDESEIRMWVREIKKASKKVDILICNAGYAPANMLATITPGKVLDKILKTNVEGTFLLCKEVAKIMMKNNYGRIVTISSMSAGLHLEGTSAYAASKAAVREFTRIIAKELERFNITCNTVAPSMYMTESVEAMPEEVIEYALNSLTQKRVLDIEEIYHVIDFFTDIRAKSVTGQIIYLGLAN